MASQTQGIQQLLAAEKRAADKVAEARKSKLKTKNTLPNFLFAHFFLDFQPLLNFILRNITDKARRLKQAKEEAQAEIESYRQEREKQFKDFESKVSKILTADLSYFLSVLANAALFWKRF